MDIWMRRAAACKAFREREGSSAPGFESISQTRYPQRQPIGVVPLTRQKGKVPDVMIHKKRECNAQKDVQDPDRELHSAVGRYGARRRHGIFLLYFEQVPKSPLSVGTPVTA